jgi:hypothetical protein
MAMSRMIPALALFLCAPAAAWAQFVSAPHPEGVEMNPKGVLMSGKTEMDPRLAEIRKNAASRKNEGGLCYISLPRLFADARKSIEAKEPLPDNVRFLGGMVKLQYIFLFPDKNDLVIAGPAEPFDSKVPFRPLGLLTGRPVLQFEDLVVALRAFGPGKSPDILGCNIHITREIAARVDKKFEEISPKLGNGLKPKDAAEEMAEAGGEQPVEYLGIDPATRFAFVCVEADYRLKQLGLALIKCPVPQIKPYFMHLSRPERNHRFFLASQYEAILVSPEGDGFELRGPSLRVDTGLLRLKGTEGGEVSAAAKKYSQQCNEHFAELCRHLISWADLQNLGDLTLFAALAAREGLAGKAGWDTSWLLDQRSCPVTAYATPKSAKFLCNGRTASGMVLFTSGGVGLFPKEWIDKRESDDKGALKDKSRRPESTILIPSGEGK